MKYFLFIVVAASSILVLAESMEQYGGLVKIRGKGKLTAIDCRKYPDEADYSVGLKNISDIFGITITKSVSSDFSVKSASTQTQTSGANAVVFLIDDPAFPMALAAQEEKWAMVNAAKIKSPSKEQFSRRLSLLFMRQCCRVLGSDETKGVETCLHSVFSVEDIDAITSFDLPMGPEMTIPETMTLRGFEKTEYGTYEEACELGIAAAPTNAIQRLIWDKVHAPPTKPLKITYDRGKQKPVVK